MLCFSAGSLIPAIPGAAQPEAPITMTEAWQRVLASTPEAALLRAEREAIAAEAAQAGLRPNPELSAEIEDALGTGAYRGISRADATVQVVQLYERGGKAELRKNAVEAALPVAEAEMAVRRAELRVQLGRAFVSVLLAQERLELRRAAVELAQRTVDTLARQNAAGQASGLDLARARVEVTAAQVELEAARVELDQTRRALAAFWVGEPDESWRVAGELDLPAGVPSLEELLVKIDTSPELQRFPAEASRRQALLSLEKAAAVSDVTVGGGIRYFQEGSEGAFVLRVSIPWQIRSRNQGAIRGAQLRLAQVPLEMESARLALRAELAQRYAELAAAHREAEAIGSQLMPAAEEVVRQTENALSQGRVTLLQVLDAQRTLLESRERRLGAVARYLAARLAVDRLIEPVKP